MRWNEIVNETSTAGSTASGNVATSVGKAGMKGSIGAGFDSQGHKGIYDAAERKKGRKKS